jgi:hypothetical protein
MLKSIEGVYRNGKIELSEVPGNVDNETRVIVTFLASSPIDLHTLGISEAQAMDLRTRLRAFGEEWDRPEMTIYDDYDAAKSTV